MNHINIEAQRWLEEVTGLPFESLELIPMEGATSSKVYLVRALTTDLSKSNKFKPLVLRVLDNQKWLSEEPDLALHEASALEEAKKTGLSTPELIAYSSEDMGFGAPVVLMSFLEGKVDLAVSKSNMHIWLQGIAETLVTIHSHSAEEFSWHFKSWLDKTTLEVPKWTKNPIIWAKANQYVGQKEPTMSPLVFIHRDYHPTNVLWNQGKVSGVVDWINACRGPAGVDVAHCRTNLALMFGLEIADEFLDFYCKMAPKFMYDPYWDIASILDMCLPKPIFYAPWQAFGLQKITSEVLKTRIDAYLKSITNRFI